MNPALTSPLGAGGLTTPPVAGLDPALATTPISNAAGLPAPGEVPISAPIGLDPAAGTYPILGGDPGLGLGAMPAAAASTGGGGLFGDLSSAAQQLGAGQAIDLLKGVVMPMITSAMKPAAALPAPPAPVPTPACRIDLSPNGAAEPSGGLCGAVAGHLDTSNGSSAVSKHWQQLTHT